MGNAESTAQPANAAVQSEMAAEEDDEPSWWHAIEHENLVLEQQPAEMEPKTSSSSGQSEKEQQQQQQEEQAQLLDLDEFKAELASKRAARQTAVQDMRDELATLRQQLATERAENRRLRGEQQDEPEPQPEQRQELDEDDVNPSSRSRHANIELANAQLALQLANADNLSLRSELEVVQRQVGTLKEVICCCKQMLSVKEEQCAQLKMKLQQIENSFSEREMKIMSNNLRQEYERQLVNIRQLRQLYEERQRVAAAEYENLQRLISIKKDELLAEQDKTKNYEERHQLLLGELEAANEQLAKLREECGEHKYEKRVLKEQVGAVNLLFSQLVLGNGKHNMDIDRLTKMLEENRDLLNEMTLAEGSCSGDGAMLPKLLFELVEQAAAGQEASDKSRSGTPKPELEPKTEAEAETEAEHVQLEPSADQTDALSHEPEIMGQLATAQEIIGNLPKVWKVLMELLSHHKIERVQFEEMTAATTAAAGGAAAAAVDGGSTTKSPELSVSKTYIKLKDLIMEKKSLVKETTRLKTLNCHLDNRLNEQEKRLSAVSLELTKTWHLVGKMQRQHRQLHTQEQILRYQLQQKRRLLSELKDELEYCRRKWALARAKNDESQELCNDWRREFARRKLEDANHSAESGYSDSGPQSDEDSGAGAAAASAQGEHNMAAGESSACRRKHLRDQFEHTRKIKRMQSTSPGRQAAAAAAAAASATAAEEPEEIVLRWNSAPPTCGWRELEEEDVAAEDLPSTSRGAVPKTLHSSRSRQRSKTQPEGSTPEPSSSPATADRIHKLEEQCKSLIQQVLETSGNRERLEIQLCQFQDEITPAQHAVPLEEFINRKRLERMTRASSAPATGSLTPREEEYTRKRSERLGRLEEESRQLMSRIKRTADRGHYLKKSLDRIRRAPSREGSFESNTEEEPKQEEAPAADTQSPLTVEEEAYTSRRAARLQRMEQESQQLLTQLSRNTQRGESLSSRLDTLHERHDGTTSAATAMPSTGSISLTVEQRLEDIERVSASRAERLRRLEEQGNELIARLSNTSERGTAMINRIAEREANRRQIEEAELLEQLPATAAEATTVEETPGAACCATVTTTPSQLAVQQSTGAIPKIPSAVQHKTKPLAQLCAAARHVDASRKRTKSEQEQEQETQLQAESESLENMVQRLRAIPYPEEGQQEVELEQPKQEVKPSEREQEEEEEQPKEVAGEDLPSEQEQSIQNEGN